MTVAATDRAIRLAEVVILVVDAGVMLERQDLAIARRVAEEGRALVIAVNKWDLMASPAQAIRRLHDRIERSLPQSKGVATVTMSALTGENTDRLMPAVLRAHETWTRRIPTGALNRWLRAMVEAHPPPAARGRPLRLRYVTQTKARPPRALPESYLRYLENGLREAFGLAGTPLRLTLRRGRNPYVEDS
jgi:GTP-binding protein